MANESISTGSIIKTSQLIDYFTQRVRNRVLSGAAHAGNIPYSYNTNMNIIPPSYLGSISRIPTPIVGSKNSRINANTIYKGLLDVTRYLLRVGTYTYSESKSVTGKWPHGRPSECYRTIAGKALFSDSFAANGSDNSGRKLGNLETAAVQPSPTQSPVLSTNIIKASDLKALIDRCYNAWDGNRKPHYNAGHHVYCHSSCHRNCHSSCHGNDQGSTCHWDSCHGPNDYSNSTHCVKVRDCYEKN